MDSVSLRLLFVAGLVVLGALAVLMGMVLSSLTERWSSRQGRAAVSRSGASAARPGVRALSLDRSSARVDTCQP